MLNPPGLSGEPLLGWTRGADHRAYQRYLNKLRVKIGNDRKKNSHRSGSTGLTPSAITALL